MTGAQSEIPAGERFCPRCGHEMDVRKVRPGRVRGRPSRQPAPDGLPTCFGAESDPCSLWRPATALYGPLNDEGPTLEYLGEYVGYVDARPGQTPTYAREDGIRKSIVIDGPEGILVLPGAAGDPEPEFEQP